MEMRLLTSEMLEAAITRAKKYRPFVKWLSEVKGISYYLVESESRHKEKYNYVVARVSTANGSKLGHYQCKGFTQGLCKHLPAAAVCHIARKMWKKIGATGECAVRGDLILTERYDNFTKRTVAVALNR